MKHNQPGFRGIFLLMLVFLTIVAPLAAQSGAKSGDAPPKEEFPADIDVALYAVGSLSASNLYLSYLVLGTVADSYSQGIYTEEVAASLTNEAMFMNTNAQRALEQLLSQGRLAPEDAAAVQRIAQTYSTLTKEAEALILFINDKENTGEEFQTYRREAWQQISTLLGLDSSGDSPASASEEASDSPAAQPPAPEPETSEDSGSTP